MTKAKKHFKIVLLSLRRGTQNLLYRALRPAWFYRYGAKILVRVLYRCRFEGVHHIPDKGPALLICNHVSYMDGLVIHAASKRPVRFIIDANIYKVPFVHYFMSMANAIPIQPTRQSVKYALEQVREAMEAGDVVCIFPEGSLTYTGNMTRFRFGIEWMAKESRVPVIPMALKGLWGSIFSRAYLRKRWPFMPRSFRRHVALKIGSPISWQQAQVNLLQREVMRLKNSLDTEKPIMPSPALLSQKHLPNTEIQPTLNEEPSPLPHTQKAV